MSEKCCNKQEPKYICHCSKVTEEEMLDAILNKNAKTVKDVCEITKAEGVCCKDDIQALIDKTLK